MKKILVTGAGGFLGYRLTEVLLDRKFDVRAMAHRPSGAVRLAGLAVDICWCDINNEDQVARAVAGCDIVVHCAYGTAGAARDVSAVTVRGTENLLKASVHAGVKQFIHISTIAVYSYRPDKPVSEDSAFGRPTDNYCKDKIHAEKIVAGFLHKSPLAVTILRMGNIFGPFSGPWTMRPIAHIKAGLPVVVDGGKHASNFVYVDNAVEAIVCAMENTRAYGEAFFITDDERPWCDYYAEYANWLGKSGLESVDESVVDALEAKAGKKIRNWFSDVWSNFCMPVFRYSAFAAAENRSLGPLVSGIWRHVPSRFRELLIGPELAFLQKMQSQDKAGSNTVDVPLGLLQVYAGRGVFSNLKAKKQLGFGPKTDFERAMRRTREWAEWARLI